MIPNEKRSHLWNVHRNLSDSIRFSDAKAGAVMTLGAALIGVLFSGRRGPLNFGQAAGWLGVFFWGAAAALVAGAASALWAVRPRLSAETGKGLVYWSQIVNHSKAVAYLEAMNDDDAVDRDLTDQIIVLAKICSTKFRFVNIALSFLAVGAVLGLVSAISSPG